MQYFVLMWREFASYCLGLSRLLGHLLTPNPGSFKRQKVVPTSCWLVSDFGEIGEGFSSPCKQVYACHHFIDYGGEARQAGQVSFFFLFTVLRSRSPGFFELR